MARQRNLRHATYELNLTRGAISQGIKQLEIGNVVSLLERQVRGVSLTREGERCRAAVDKALATLETVIENLGQAGEQISLHLRSSTAAEWLMPRVGDFEERFPRVSLRTEGHTRRLGRDLAHSEIAIWPGKASDAKQFQNARLLTNICLVAVCGPDFPMPNRPTGVSTLLPLPLIQDSLRRWEKLIEATGHCGRHKLLNFDCSALALDAAIGERGVAIVPSYLVDGDVSRKRPLKVSGNPEQPTKHLFVS